MTSVSNLLRNINSIDNLTISDNQINTLDGIRHLDGLDLFIADNNNITSLSVFRFLRNIETISVRNNPIRAIGRELDGLELNLEDDNLMLDFENLE